MTSNLIPLTEGLDALLADSTDAHPDPERLVRYHEGVLDMSERDLVAEHLARCRDCADLVLDLATLAAEFDALAELPITHGDTARSETWQVMRGRLNATPKDAPGPPDRRAPSNRHAGRWRSHLATAALLLLGLGLGFLGAPRQVQESVVGNLELVELRSETLRSGTESPLNRLSFTESTDHIGLILSTPRAPTHSAHSCEIIDQTGRAIWSTDRLEPTEFGTFTLLLSREAMPTGRYRIDLFGMNDAERVRLASFPLEIANGGGHR